MTKLLVQGEAILAKDVAEVGDEIHSPDQIIPKHVIEGWQIVDVDVPDGFTCANYSWNGDQVQVIPPVVLAPVVPKEVSRRKGLQQLRIEGYAESDIEALIPQLPISDLDKDLALIEFRTSQTFERNRPLVSMLAALLDKDDTWIDAMFIAADQLP